MRDRSRFRKRFGCYLIEGYGQSEGGASMNPVLGMPKGAIGKPVDGVDLAVISPETGEECARAEFDADGRLLNAGEATGEIVNRSGRGKFEGYYHREDAEQERLRGGWYWTGDLGYVDKEGFFYFAGRSGDWLRVDSENFAAGPVEAILSRNPDLAVVAVYPVPDTASGAGDQLMVAVETTPGRPFDADAFGAWLLAQPDLGPKWIPRYVRISESLPQTATGKVTKVGSARRGVGVRRTGLVAPPRQHRRPFRALDRRRPRQARSRTGRERPPARRVAQLTVAPTTPAIGSTPVSSATRWSPGSSTGATCPSRSSARHTWTAVMPIRRGPRTSGSQESPTNTTRVGSIPSASVEHAVDAQDAASANRPAPR